MDETYFSGFLGASHLDAVFLSQGQSVFHTLVGKIELTLSGMRVAFSALAGQYHKARYDRVRSIFPTLRWTFQRVCNKEDDIGDTMQCSSSFKAILLAMAIPCAGCGWK